MIGNVYGIKIKKSGQLHSDHFHSSIGISYSKVKRLFVRITFANLRIFPQRTNFFLHVL